jgi:ribose-phosphate pyrophosphokinase
MTDCLGIKLFAGNSNIELGKKVASKLSLPLGKVKVGKFSNGETAVTIEESVRNYDVCILAIEFPNG